MDYKMIKLEKITKIYNAGDLEVRALDGVDLNIEDGEMLAVMGPSGSGKSTMLNILGLMDITTSGNYIVDDTKINELSNKARHVFRKEHISFVFQNFALMSRYTVFENIELPLLARKIKKADRKKIVEHNMELVGIKELSKKYPSQISGGQQQRCAIARALAAGNDIILADEPTGALDQKTGQEIINIFKKINELGKTVIIVTHDINVANQCKRIINIVDGKIEDNKD